MIRAMRLDPLVHRIPTAMIPFVDLTLFAFAGAVAVLAAMPRAQSEPKPAAIDPAVAAILDKMAAKRGPAAAGNETAITIEGDYAVTFEGVPDPVAKGTFREIFVGRDLARHTSTIGQFAPMEKGVRGDVVWEVDPMIGAKVHRGRNAAVVRRYFALLRCDDPRTVYREITIARTDKADDRSVTVLEARPAEGSPDMFHVDSDGTLLRIETALPAPESADATWDMPDLMPSAISFTEWKKVEGGTFPMRRTLTMGKAKVSFVCTTTTVGGTIDAARFAPPAAVDKVEVEHNGPAFDASGKPIHQIVDRQKQLVASIRVKVAPTAISKELATLLPEVHQYLVEVGAKMAGPPFSRYHAWSETEIDLEAGIPVQEPITPKGRIVNGELPAGRTVAAWHVGPYDGLRAAHERMRTWIEQQKLKVRGGCWEIYWTDPGMVPDPAKWRTQLFTPVE